MESSSTSCIGSEVLSTAEFARLFVNTSTHTSTLRGTRSFQYQRADSQ
jgi:hypothetical protein